MKTKSQYQFSLQTYVKFFNFKIQNGRHSTEAECEKEPFGEKNRFSISLFVNEIIQQNKNSRWLPGEFHLGPTDQDEYMCEVS